MSGLNKQMTQTDDHLREWYNFRHQNQNDMLVKPYQQVT